MPLDALSNPANERQPEWDESELAIYMNPEF